MVNRFSQYFILSLCLCSVSVMAKFKPSLAPTGFYSSISLGIADAKEDVSIPDTPDRFVESRDAKLVETAWDGYQINQNFGVELGVAHVGKVSFDLYFLLGRVMLPAYKKFQFYLKPGIVYAADDKAGYAYGGGVEYFLKPDFSVHGQVMYYDVPHLNTHYLNVIYDLGLLKVTSLGINKYLGICDSACRRKAPTPSHEGTYVGASFEGTRAYRGIIEGESEASLQNIWEIQSLDAFTYNDATWGHRDMHTIRRPWGFGIRHGYQLSPYYSVELQILHSTAISHISYKQVNFYTVDNRLSYPLYELKKFGHYRGHRKDIQFLHTVWDNARPYLKYGMAYSQEGTYFVNLGIGTEVFINQQLAFNVMWQRLNDFANSTAGIPHKNEDVHYTFIGAGLNYYLYKT